ncbi:hypothetical protein SASPL_152773 [Salvia splendens]|uniref:Uncharacterized protein n=1 Tax=Salvia splendens TaxID=180675 RepID=A0A8X8Z0N9_SALSN|nr:uncharacterized protein At4g38062-like [Salvia splendens]KAG6387581.1 hypothetical protein SASPL_152773 [Salvia splendens]
MDAVYQELDDAKAEIEKLREQYHVKVELAETLKRFNNDQVSKNKEASSKLEKIAEELNEKEGEIATAKQVYDELKINLAEKESIIRRITSAHDKLRVDCNEKLHKLEEENKALASALDDSNGKNINQEQQISALKQEVEGVKRLLNVSQKKSAESESRTATSKDVGVREDAFFKLEEEKKKLEYQLKWKKEQFVHLEEAHDKLRKNFKMREKEWEKERAELVHGISSLEEKLESQTRISQDLQKQLEMCNSALAHAESKRKVMEVQLLESRTSLDNVSAEYDEAKLNFDNLATQRDQEIATLRSSLGTKDILYKEMEYQFRKLEQEKQELLVSLKDHQEAQIRESSFSSASKLQNKLKSLEQVHKGCSTNLKAKESEWHSQMEKLSQELDYFKSEVESKDSSLNELNKELEACDSLTMKLELLNQETSLMLLVLKSGFSEAQFRLADDHSCMNLKNKQVQENVCELMQQLEQKKAALISVQEDLEDERQKVVILSKKVQELEELQFPLQKEVDRLKEILKESTSSRLHSEEQMLLIQADLNRVREALERADDELYEKFREANEIEFELRMWKSVAEQLEANLKQNHQMRKEVEASLLAQTEVELNLKQEKQSLSHQLEEKEREIDELQQQLVLKATIAETSCWNAEEDSLPQVDVRKSLHQLVEEKNQRISDLQQLVASLEHEFDSSTTSFSSRLSQMQREMNVLRESWEKIKADGVLKEMEIQEKNIMITELENDLHSLTKRVQQDKIEDAVQKQELEIRRLELDSKISTSEKTIKILSSENQKLIDTIGSLSEKMNKLTAEDLQLMERLGSIVKSLPGDEEQENINILAPPMKKVEFICEGRSPLRAIVYN